VRIPPFFCSLALLCVALPGCVWRSGKKRNPQEKVVKAPRANLHYKRIVRLPLEEAQALEQQCEASGQWEIQLKALERIFVISRDRRTSEETLFKLGMLYLEHKQSEQALAHLSIFRQLFPGSVHKNEARLAELKAAQALMIEIGKDSAGTERVIELGTTFLRDLYRDPELHEEVSGMVDKAYKRLLEKEIAYILRFYRSKYAYRKNAATLEAMIVRLIRIREEVFTPWLRTLSSSEIEEAANTIDAFLATYPLPPAPPEQERAEKHEGMPTVPEEPGRVPTDPQERLLFEKRLEELLEYLSALVEEPRILPASLRALRIF
jgi:tetratricopeptide (TPR) repeat protein